MLSNGSARENSKQGKGIGKSDRKLSKLIVIGILLSLVVSGCSENKFTQCEQIFQIANSITENSKNVNDTNDKQQIEMKNWLEAANMLDIAADKIKALHIDDSELIGYQNGLVTIYRIYSQATYDAVNARESKNLKALKIARIHAEKAGEMQQSLIKEINDYCLKTQ